MVFDCPSSCSLLFYYYISACSQCVLCNCDPKKFELILKQIIQGVNHVTSDDRVHGISEKKLLNTVNIFLDIFVNTSQN